MTGDTERRGRPRDERSAAAILAATRTLIEQVGYAGTSVNAIAAAARVGKDTIYRRWSGKPELVFEALFTTTEEHPVPDTGSLRGDLTVIAAGLVAEFSTSGARAALPGVLADYSADAVLRERIKTTFLAPGKDRLKVVFDRARERHEVLGDVPVDLVLDTLVGAVFFHIGLLGEAANPRVARRLGSMIADGLTSGTE